MRAGVVLTASEYMELTDDRIAPNPTSKAIPYSLVRVDDRAGVGHGRGRLDSPQAWTAVESTPGQWFQVFCLLFILYFGS